MKIMAYWSVWLLVFVMPFENLVVVPGLGTLGKICGIGAAGVGLIALVVSRSGLRWSSFHWVFLSYVLWSTVAFYWSVDLDDSLKRVILHFQLFVMVCVIYQWVQDRRAVHGLLAAYVLGCYVSLFSLFRNFSAEASATGGQRYAATAFNPNDISTILVLGIPAAWFLGQQMSGRKTAWLFRIYPFIVSLGVALTGSRNGLIILLIAWAYVLLTLPRLSLRNKIAIFSIGVVAVWVGIDILPAASFERWATIGYELSSGSLNSRGDIWRSGVEIFSNSPLQGTGPGTFSIAVSTIFGRESSPHNVYLSILVELGLIGFGIFVALLIVVIRSIIQMPASERLFWAFLLGSLLLAANLLNWEWRKQLWLFFVLPVVHLNVLRMESDSGVENEVET